MSYEWAAKEKQQPRPWTEWISNIHKAATTTWLGVFMVLFVGVPANVAAWYMFFWIFWTQASLAVILIGDTIIDLTEGSIILAILNVAVIAAVAITARIAYRRYKEIP